MTMLLWTCTGVHAAPRVVTAWFAASTPASTRASKPTYPPPSYGQNLPFLPGLVRFTPNRSPLQSVSLLSDTSRRLAYASPAPQ